MNAIALVIAVVALLIALWLAIDLTRVKRIVYSLPKDGGVYEALRQLDADLAKSEETIDGILPRLAAVEGRLPLTIQHLAVVDYDAFGDMAGNLSRSIALLDGNGDGIVISLLVGRDETRWFTKQVVAGGGVDPLSPEESAAVRQAMAE
jgi:hypothetical protein